MFGLAISPWHYWLILAALLLTAEIFTSGFVLAGLGFAAAAAAAAAAQAWGVKVNRVEVQDIIPPQDVQASMEQQMKAERERRARVTEAEGFKRAAVLRAEGERDARIAEAEGEKAAAITEAEGDAQAIERLATAEKTKLELVEQALGGDPSNYLIGVRYMETLDKMAANNNVVWMPHSATDLGSFIGGYRHLLSEQPPTGPTPKAPVD